MITKYSDAYSMFFLIFLLENTIRCHIQQFVWNFVYLSYLWFCFCDLPLHLWYERITRAINESILQFDSFSANIVFTLFDIQRNSLSHWCFCLVSCMQTMSGFHPNNKLVYSTPYCILSANRFLCWYWIYFFNMFFILSDFSFFLSASII